jgi:CubicO group peptidase (beta-lactamase class C family)
MTAGFPTDDPWGDRQQGLDVDRFIELVGDGLSFAWSPGTRFEYSNLGYGILGRLITAVAGREYDEVVRDRILEPLGMAATTFQLDDVPAERLARGYVWRDDRFLAEPIDGYGALAAMGGIFTTLGDLTTWVRGFVDAFPPRDEPGMTHPLRRATRREMQMPHVTFEPAISIPTADGEPQFDGLAYGYGLFIQDHLRWGRIVGHSGGYPGYGSTMRWHPASGVGVIALANGRYAPATALGRALIDALLEADVAPVRRIVPGPATLAARTAVEALLESWDDDRASRSFAMNVELDEPLARRRAAVERLRSAHGRLERDESEPAVSSTPFHLEWWLRGERGRVKAEILLSPELPPLVQALTLTSVPDPSPALVTAAEQVVAALGAGGGAAVWPAALALDDGVDVAAHGRGPPAAEARYGPVRLGPAVAGDGLRSATFQLACARGRLELALERDPATGVLKSVALVPAKLAPAGVD